MSVEAGTLVGDVFTVEHSLTKRIKDVGPVTFSADELRAAGVQGTETAYPDLRITAKHVVAGEPGALQVAVPLTVYQLVSDPIPQTCSQTPGTKNRFVTTEWYYEAPGEPPTTVYVQFAANLTRQYHVSMVDAFAGTSAYRTRIRAQVSTLPDTAPVMRDIVNTSNNLLVDRFLYPHIDQISVVAIVGLYNQFLKITGSLHLGNLSFAEASSEEVWSCVLLDANFERISYGSLSYDNAVRVSIRNNMGDQIPFNQAPVDVQHDFYLRLWTYLTSEDVAYFNEHLAYVVFVNTAPFKEPSISSVGWGRIDMTMVDMFGRLGNTTPLSGPSSP